MAGSAGRASARTRGAVTASRVSGAAGAETVCLGGRGRSHTISESERKQPVPGELMNEVGYRTARSPGGKKTGVGGQGREAVAGDGRGCDAAPGMVVVVEECGGGESRGGDGKLDWDDGVVSRLLVDKRWREGG